MDLLNLCETKQRHRCVLVCDRPSESQLSLCAAELFSEHSELIQHFDGGLFFTYAEVLLECCSITITLKPGALWSRAIVVLTGQDSLTKR